MNKMMITYDNEMYMFCLCTSLQLFMRIKIQITYICVFNFIYITKQTVFNAEYAKNEENK